MSMPLHCIEYGRQAQHSTYKPCLFLTSNQNLLLSLPLVPPPPLTVFNILIIPLSLRIHHSNFTEANDVEEIDYEFETHGDQGRLNEIKMRQYSF
jgi:hypothetical protein